jgi:hypothetical protein
VRCETARERMLDADPAALSDPGSGALGRHIAGCAACSRRASVLVAGLAAIDEAIGRYGSAGDADTAARAALAGVRNGEPRGSEPRESTHPTRPERVPGGVPGPRRRSRTLRPWLPLAAAAAITAILVIGRGDAPRPGPTPTPEPPGTEPRVTVAPPVDRAAAILETANPDITIIWLYDREES